MYIIGIAGGTGSGKTTVVKKIMKALEGENVAVIPQDSYYNDNTHLTMEERRKINYDHPDAFDWNLLCQQLHELRQGKAIEQPTSKKIFGENCYNSHTRRILDVTWRKKVLQQMKKLKLV